MAKRDVYSNFIEMPKGIQGFLLKEVEDYYDKIIADYQLPSDKFFDNLDAPILDAIMGISTIKDSLQKIHFFLSSLQMEEKREIELFYDVLKNIFWPLRELFGDELMVFLRDQEINTADWPRRKILFKPVSFTGAASELVNHLGLHSAGRQMHDKLRDILKDLSQGKTVEDEVRELMTRSTDLGGLGFDQAMADKALTEIKNITSNIELMDEEDYREYLAGHLARTLNLDNQAGFEEPDDDQIKTLKAGLPSKPKEQTELDKAVDYAWSQIEKKPDGQYLQKRLQNVISSRLRDVRNAMELKGLLQRDTKVGGLGLTGEEAEAMAAVIEKAYQETRATIEQEERKKFESQLTEQKRKIEDRRQQESEEHARWYQEKIQKKQVQETEQRQFAQAVKKELKTQAGHPLDGKDAALERSKYGQLVTVASAAPAAERLERPTGLGFAKDNRQPPTPASPQTQAPVIKVSAATAELKQRPGAVSVDGVRTVRSGAPKLHGLIDELRGMTLSGFRRLGKEPKDSVNRINQYLSTLNEESFSQKVHGIKAWQSSPLMRAYLDLVTESFKQGKPLAAIAEAKRAAGENTLTKDELEVLINLNNSMHF